jgi:transposase
MARLFPIDISVRTIERIVKEGDTMVNNTGEAKFSTPRKKRPRKCSVTELPEYELCNIRHIIHDFHKTEGSRVSLLKLTQKIKKELNWNGSKESLRTILGKIGFKWRKTQNNRQLLIEKNDIRALRISYLEKIKYFRSQNQPIIFLDETYLHSGHTSSKNWTDESTKGLFPNISKGQRLIMVHAGGDMGFIPNCLLIFKSGTKTGDYHSEMNAQNYGKWLEEKLIPNIPANSVIVTDNAPYHNVQLNPAPTSNSKKADMVKWLTEKNITFQPTMLKPQLYQIIKHYKKRYVSYKFDALLRDHGHTVLRLPPYHPDLNPIELIWATVKNNVAKKTLLSK